MQPDKHSVIKTLQSHQSELEAFGVTHAAIVGSVARGEATEASDIDVYVEIDVDRRPRGFAVVTFHNELRARLKEILGREVDLIRDPISKPRLAEEVKRDAVRAF